jgi:hypothetical protein
VRELVDGPRTFAEHPCDVELRRRIDGRADHEAHDPLRELDGRV